MTIADGLESLVVRPGDRLVIRVHPRIEPPALEQLKAAVEERLPGVEALVLGVDQIAVYKPEPADG